MDQQFAVTPRTRLKRIPDRASYDRAEAYAILDEGLIGHVGFADGEDVYVIPMAYARQDDRLLLHGSVASRLAKRLGEGLPISVCVTLLDGMVLARSVFEHSMNYRSVVCLGSASVIAEQGEKLEALRVLTEHLLPGRWADARQPNAKELAATTVLALPLVEVSVKSRSGPPDDLEKDKALPHWAGVIPLQLQPGAAQPDALAANTAIPDYVLAYQRPAG